MNHERSTKTLSLRVISWFDLLFLPRAPRTFSSLFYMYMHVCVGECVCICVQEMENRRETLLSFYIFLLVLYSLVEGIFLVNGDRFPIEEHCHCAIDWCGHNSGPVIVPESAPLVAPFSGSWLWLKWWLHCTAARSKLMRWIQYNHHHLVLFPPFSYIWCSSLSWLFAPTQSRNGPHPSFGSSVMMVFNWHLAALWFSHICITPFAFSFRISFDFSLSFVCLFARPAAEAPCVTGDTLHNLSSPIRDVVLFFRFACTIPIAPVQDKASTVNTTKRAWARAIFLIQFIIPGLWTPNMVEPLRWNCYLM